MCRNALQVPYQRLRNGILDPGFLDGSNEFIDFLAVPGDIPEHPVDEPLDIVVGQAHDFVYYGIVREGFGKNQQVDADFEQNKGIAVQLLVFDPGKMSDDMAQELIVSDGAVNGSRDSGIFSLF